MKRYLMMTVICLLAGTVLAQDPKAAGPNGEQHTTLTPVLTAYYAIKDALVNDNSNLAAAHARTFLEALNAVDLATLQGKEKETLSTLKPELESDAQKMATTQKIEGQRTLLASLSLHMWAVLKEGHYPGTTIYQEYCPMKKAYWISRESSIKNPYYGKQMLGCGKVTETLK